MSIDAEKISPAAQGPSLRAKIRNLIFYKCLLSAIIQGGIREEKINYTNRADGGWEN